MSLTNLREKRSPLFCVNSFSCGLRKTVLERGDLEVDEEKQAKYPPVIVWEKSMEKRPPFQMTTVEVVIH